MENAPTQHAGIGFLPEGFHSLHRFLSLSNARLAACRTEVFSQALRSAVTGLAEPADLAFSW
jgi:hypothetical protein